MGVTAATAFDEATAATRAGEGRYDVLPDARFATAPASAEVQSAVNGGILLASMLRGVLDESVHPHPVAASADSAGRLVAQSRQLARVGRPASSAAGSRSQPGEVRRPRHGVA